MSILASGGGASLNGGLRSCLHCSEVSGSGKQFMVKLFTEARVFSYYLEGLKKIIGII